MSSTIIGSAWPNTLSRVVRNTAPPTTGDDINKFYEAGDQWEDTVAKKIYTCENSAVGAAVWVLTAVGSSASFNVRTVNGTSDTLLAGDNGNVVRYFLVGGDCTVTIPLGFPVGYNTILLQEGPDRILLTTAGGVTLSNIDGFTKSEAQFARMELIHHNTSANDLYNLSGRTGA